MDKKLIFFLMCLLSIFVIPLTAATKKVHTIGDSTMANYATDGSTEKRGWAQMLQQFFNSDNVSVNNRGKSGASSKSFYQETGYWNTLVKGGTDQMQSGDYLLIQFAHNDEKTSGTDGDSLKAYYIAKGDATTAATTDYRGTTAFDTYKAYMRKYIDEAKAMGVTPIVVGPICRKYFSTDGTDITRSGRHDLGDSFSVLKDGQLLTKQSVPATDDTYDYVEAAKAVAAEYDDVPFIDLTTLTANLYISKGLDYCTDNLFNKDASTDGSGKIGDSTHPNALGATLIAREFVKQLVSQANSETDAKKKAVLQALAADAILSNEITFNPTSGDMGEAMMGTQVVKEFNISAFGLPSESGNITVSTTDGFEVSADQTTWSQSASLAYTGYTLTSTIYVRATAAATVLTGTLTATDGTNSKSLDLTLTPISIPGGIDVTATWPLASGATPTSNDALTLSDESLTGLKVVYGAIGSDNKKMQLLDPESGSWGANELDEVSTRYAQFKVTVPEGKTFYATNISYNVAARGGSAVSYHAYCSVNDDFSDPVLLDEKVSMTKDNVMAVNKSLVKSISDGESLYIRIYPWYNNQSKTASGKYLCVSDMTVAGIIGESVVETTFGLGRELDTTTNTFASGQEQVTGTAPTGTTVTNISTCDYSGTNQTLKHGTSTPTYTAPNVWRNYWNADPTGTKTIKGAYFDGFYWGFKVSIPSGKALNVSKIYSDVYGVKNTLTSKFVVKQSLEGNAIYESDSHAANVESGTCAFTEEVSSVAALQKLEGNVYFLMPWYSGSSATYYALKDFQVTAILANAESATKYALTTSVSPTDAGVIVQSPEGANIKEGTSVTLSANKNFGYKFKEWQDETGAVVSTESEYTFTMDADKTVNAIFESVPVYTITTLCKNDADRSLGSITLTPNDHNGKYEAGTEVTATAATSKILKFLNWEDNTTTNPRAITVDKDMTITANYEVQDFIAVFDASAVQGYAYNSTYPFPADLTWDANRNATASVVKATDGTLVKGTSGTPVVRNRIKVVIDGINGLYQNGYKTSDIAWQYQFSTKDFTSATFTADMAAKNAATKQYKAQYSIDGKTFIDLGEAWECAAFTLKSLEFPLPTDVMKKDVVYIRITGIGDEVFNSTYEFNNTDEETGLSYTTNSESGVGNVYVMGEAKVAEDTEAPYVTSTLPVADATNVSAGGAITISYNERIQSGSLQGATATFDGKTVTPVWNTRSISFSYAGLEYGSQHTLTIPAGYVEDKSGNAAPEYNLTFTVMDRQKPTARIFDAVVDKTLNLEHGKFIAATETMPKQYRYIQDAIDDAPDASTRPYLIFIKEGYYNDPNVTFNDSYGQYYDTTQSDPKTTYKIVTNSINGNGTDKSDPSKKWDDCRLVYCNKPNIHLIGQGADKVTIATDRLDGGDLTRPEKAWYHVNAGAALEIQAGADDFAAQGITIANENWTKDKKAGPQALCINANADRVTFDNMNVVSYQDDFYSHGQKNRYYWNDSRIEGAVDFIYGEGNIWFENTTIDINREKGGYIVAPSHQSAYNPWGYVFNNTKITSTYYDADKCQVYLGRPWHDQPVTVFLHTKMEVQPYTGYWYPTMGGLPSLWAVYDITDKNGTKMSEESISEFYYTDSEGIKHTGTSKNFLTDEEVTNYTVTNVMAGDGTSSASGVWNPLPVVEKTATPIGSVNGNIATWTTDDYAICYVVTVNGNPSAFVTGNRYVGNEGDIITIQSVNENGFLSPASNAITLGTATAITTINADTDTLSNQNGLFTLDGKRINSAVQHGVYIQNGKKLTR